MDKKINLKFTIIYTIIQILYLAGFCAIITYSTNYLVSLGFSLSVVGIILSIANILGLVVQPLTASYVDNHPELSIQKITAVVCIAAGIVSGAVFLFNPPAILQVVLYLTMHLLFGVLGPLISSLAFVFEKDNIEINFGVARAAGSGSYALATLLLGKFIDDVGMKLMFISYAVIVFVLALTTTLFKVPDNKQNKEEEKKEDGEVLSFGQFMLKYKNFTLFIIGSSIVLFAHASVDTYFSNIIGEFGGTTEQMGQALSLAAAVEIPGMVLYDRLKNRFSVPGVMIFSLISFIVKYVITLLANNMTMIMIAESMQMLAYALFTPGTVYVGKLCVDSKDMVKGQTLVNMTISFSGILASLVGGFALDYMSVKPYLVITTIASAIGSVAMIYAMKVDKEKLINK